MRRNSDASDSQGQCSVCLDLPYPISANRYWRSYLPRGHARPVVVLSEEAKRYKEGVLSIARSMGLTKPMPGRVRVAIHLYPARPKDWKIRSLKQPDSWDDSVRSIDLDNAIKVTLDALKGIAFGDDKWVWGLSAQRMEPDGDARMAVVVSRIQIAPPVDCGMTKGGLIALQLLPEDMPKPARPLDDNGGQASLFEFAASAARLTGATPEGGASELKR